MIGVAPHERTATRTGQRNGHRLRTLSSTAGIWSCGFPSSARGRSSPRCRNGGGGRISRSSPSSWRPAYTAPRPARRVTWSRPWAPRPGSPSPRSAGSARTWTPRWGVPGPVPAGKGFPNVFLDATNCRARVDHRVVSQAVLVAAGVAADGHREVLAFDVGESEDGAF